MFAEVIVDISSGEVDRIFDYRIPENIDILEGCRVFVPFGKREIEGYVIGLKDRSELPPEKIKDIVSCIDGYPVISGDMLSLMRFMCGKYHLRVVDVLRLFIPGEMRGGRVKELKKQFVEINNEYKTKDIDAFIKPSAKSQRDIFFHLLETGRDSVTEINRNFSASALKNLIMRDILLIESVEIKRKPYKNLTYKEKDEIVLTERQNSVVQTIISDNDKIYLLHGVTGSGKTEVYMKAISKTLESGKSAIMLVPEISLTPQVLGSFRSRFGDSVAILHSGLSAGERFDEWRRLFFGEASVAVGARSAIFAPLQNLGLIVIDEEHDSSYISESNPRYNTLEVAQFRAKLNKANLILGSATPSIESYHRAVNKEIGLLEMPERINKRPMPEIEVVNMCREVYDGNNGMFSRRLETELSECMESGNQAMIFINRRGYSSYVICRSCGYVAKCEDCDVSLVYHKEDNVLKCHYCNRRYSTLDLCPECKSEHIGRGYVGTQQVVEKLSKMFPDKQILRMDNDTTQGKDAHVKILSEFASKRASILVGTQMIAKGHDFPDVTLVGIVDADMSLHFSDYRSAERTYQLITQVSGRAGRENKPGRVILQTYTPNNYVYKFAVKNDYKAFYDKECNLREVTKYPPFSVLLRILVTSEKESAAAETLKAVLDGVTRLQNIAPDAFYYLAAMRSPVKRIQARHRMQILMRLRVEKSDEILKKIYSVVDENGEKGVSCFVEINPSALS